MIHQFVKLKLGNLSNCEIVKLSDQLYCEIKNCNFEIQWNTAKCQRSNGFLISRKISCCLRFPDSKFTGILPWIHKIRFSWWEVILSNIQRQVPGNLAFDVLIIQTGSRFKWLIHTSIKPIEFENSIHIYVHIWFCGKGRQQTNLFLKNTILLRIF